MGYETTDFAARVLESASLVVQDGLARIDTVHSVYAQIHEEIGLEDFKERLWAVALEGRLMLASHDMPQLLTAEVRRRSEIVRGASTFNLVRC